MRQKLITLDATTWELAQKKKNFSEWVRNQLRAERNKKESSNVNLQTWRCTGCGGISGWPINEKYPFCRNTRTCAGTYEMELLV